MSIHCLRQVTDCVTFIVADFKILNYTAITKMVSDVEYKAYAYRWYILAMFCSLEMCNNIMWVTFAPISDISSSYFENGYYGSTTSINMLANIYFIAYLPGTLLGIFLMKNYNLKRTLEISGSLTMIGSLLRYIAAVYKNEWGVGSTYSVMMLGQTLAGLAQPLVMNAPPAVAAIWFPTDEREMATTIGSMFCPIGGAIGQIIPFLLVTQSSKNG